MRHRKFENHEEAIKYLEERGEVIFYGREGSNAEEGIYSYIHKGIKYSLTIYLCGPKDGLVVIRE